MIKVLKLFVGFVIVIAVITMVYVLCLFPKTAREPIGNLSFVERPDGARIAVYAAGQGPRVMLLSSLGRSVSDFNELAESLHKAGFRTIAIEMRGVGASTNGTNVQNLSLFLLADDAAAAMVTDGVTANDMVYGIGHAFGNRVVRAVATRYPDNVGGLVLIASGGSQKLNPEQRVTKALMNSFNWRMLPNKRRDEIAYAFFADGNEIPKYWLNGWYEAGAKLQIQAVQATSVSDWRAAGGITPIMVLQGAKDRIAPPETTSDLLKRDFPERVQVIVIAQAGHAILPEQPDIVARKIINFLSKIEGSSSSD
ncbi:MAG: alpha/beta hydrolase [Robiginitomaculum sp.]|nr:alpha/beta hydrolase [Robiginitomaculum sp.]